MCRRCSRSCRFLFYLVLSELSFLAMASTTVIQTGNYGKQTRPWSSGLCDCFNDMSICCMAVFCGVCLLCQNADQLDENGCCIAFCIPFPFNHAMLRVKLRTQEGIQGSICDDYCTVLCCASCALCQEAREIKHCSMNSNFNKQVMVVTKQPLMQQSVVQQPAVVRKHPAPTHAYN